jgi:hypothetical protein
MFDIAQYGKAPLEGYVFLSDPEGSTVYIIERDGLVWKQHPELVFYLNKQVRPEIWNWHTRIPGDAAWRFPEPGVPELELSGDGTSLNFICVDDQLWCRCRNDVFDVVSGRKLSPVDYEKQLEKMRLFWRQELRPFDREWQTPFLRAVIFNSVMAARMAFSGAYPHYGAGFYGLPEHDGFPPTILSVTDLYLLAGEEEKAEQFFKTYLERFIDPETGGIDYYGTSIAEYGMLLRWFCRFREPFRQQYAAYGEALRRKITQTPADAEYGLLIGSPEADERSDQGVFSHNNAQAAAGLIAYGDPMGRELAEKLIKALRFHGEKCGFLPWRLDQLLEEPENFYDERKTSYANYRYYPELLESGILPANMEEEILALRIKHNGEEYGITTMRNGRSDGVPGAYHYDDWPLWSIAAADLRAGRMERFNLAWQGHLALHISPDTLIGYEQVNAFGSPRRAYADFCIPAQLTVPRLLFEYHQRSNPQERK